MTQSIFVFGSNLAGRHGAGAALEARRHHGAILGQGVGRQGNSYAIPTKDIKLQPLPLYTIRRHALRFLDYARKHPELEFKLTAVGTGLAGYMVEQIAPMFKGAPANVIQPSVFVMFNEPKWNGFISTDIKGVPP